MVVGRDSSGANTLLPRIADRWQRSKARKVGLESLGTGTPNQLLNIVYSDQSHVEHYGNTHGNMSYVVRILVSMTVVVFRMPCLVISVNINNKNRPEITLLICQVKKCGNLIRSRIRRKLLHVILNVVCMNLDVRYEDSNCFATCLKIEQSKKRGKSIREFARVDTLLNNVNMKKVNDMYENWNIGYDGLMVG
jgi:hypothetical protein